MTETLRQRYIFGCGPNGLRHVIWWLVFVAETLLRTNKKLRLVPQAERTALGYFTLVGANYPRKSFRRLEGKVRPLNI
ncbi:hypothetical protein BH20ACI3_BH20ACI3_22970 [soil metagenome]